MAEYDIRPKLLEAYRRLFRPLVRILLRSGVSFSEFTSATKEVFIEESIKDCWRQEGNCSVARVSVVTGLTRREVEQILDAWAKDEGISDRSRLARIARLLTGWSTDPKYVGPYGWPIDVPYELVGDDHKASFVEIVKRFCGNASAQSMLTELMNVQAVSRTEAGLIRLESRAYIPEALTNESLNRLSTVVSNVVQTLDHNLEVEREEDGRFERTVAADHGLSVRLVPKLSAFLQDRGVEFLEELDAWMAANPPGADEERLGVGVGVYLYVENQLDKWNPSEFGLRSPVENSLK
jgi:Family of unknown function (DUF6502)